MGNPLEPILISCLETMLEKLPLTPRETQFGKWLLGYYYCNGRLTKHLSDKLRKFVVRLIVEKPVPGIEC